MKAHIFRPAGNDTALICARPARERELNDALMKARANVEQVGFVYTEGSRNFLQMAGGELCFNALRSAAAYFCRLHAARECSVHMCGREYRCARVEGGYATYVPAAAQVAASEREALVDLGGIVHLCELASAPFGGSDEELKALALAKLRARGLLDRPAAGFMLISPLAGAAAESGNSSGAAAESATTAGAATATTAAASGFLLQPVVYVRAIDTLFYETACGSGSFASFAFLRERLGLRSLQLRQPSGRAISLQAVGDLVAISSPVELLETIEI